MIASAGITPAFLIIVGVFLLVSAGALFALRKVLARTGVESWKSLPGGERFKSYGFQLKLSICASLLVAVAGLVVFSLAFVR